MRIADPRIRLVARAIRTFRNPLGDRRLHGHQTHGPIIADPTTWRDEQRIRKHSRRRSIEVAVRVLDTLDTDGSEDA